jgi:hypothetical protein
MFNELSSYSDLKHERIRIFEPSVECSSLPEEWKELQYEVKHEMCSQFQFLGQTASLVQSRHMVFCSS